METTIELLEKSIPVGKWGDTYPENVNKIKIHCHYNVIAQRVKIKEILSLMGIKYTISILPYVIPTEVNNWKINNFKCSVIKSVLPIFSKQYPEDKTLEKALKGYEKKINSEISKAELYDIYKRAENSYYTANEDYAYALASDFPTPVKTSSFAQVATATMRLLKNESAFSICTLVVSAVGSFPTPSTTQSPIREKAKWKEIEHLFLKYI